jgi:TrmH family RNA methyltransferase
MQRITSRRNAVVLRYRAAAAGDAPDLLLVGPRLVDEASTAGLALHHALVTAEALQRADVGPLVDRLEAAGVELATVSPAVMAAVSPTRSPAVMVALADRPATRAGRLYAEPPALVVVACDVQDPGNLGAMARGAEAGGASGLVAAGACADPYGWKALRGSMGSLLRLPTLRCRAAEDAAADARTHRCRVIAAMPREGRSLFEADLSGSVALLVGGEGPGLDAALAAAADERVSIPMRPPVESLNAAVAAALLVYEARRQRSA